MFTFRAPAIGDLGGEHEALIERMTPRGPARVETASREHRLRTPAVVLD